MVNHDCDVAVVGAGPYGLACAAHLRDGLDVRLFGEPMSFWTNHMPEGMLLRSPYVASHIADPDRALTLDDYQQREWRRSGTAGAAHLVRELRALVPAAGRS